MSHYFYFVDSLQNRRFTVEHQQRAILKYFVIRVPLRMALPVLDRVERNFFCRFFEWSKKKKHLEAEVLACEKLGVSVSFLTVF